jgi:hypothetical protein
MIWNLDTSLQTKYLLKNCRNSSKKAPCISLISAMFCRAHLYFFNLPILAPLKLSTLAQPCCGSRSGTWQYLTPGSGFPIHISVSPVNNYFGKKNFNSMSIGLRVHVKTSYFQACEIYGFKKRLDIKFFPSSFFCCWIWDLRYGK